MDFAFENVSGNGSVDDAAADAAAALCVTRSSLAARRARARATR